MMILNILNLLTVALLVASCKPGVKVIRETPILVVEGPTYKKEENASLEKLKEYSESIEPLSSALTSLRTTIDTDKTSLDSLYDELTRVDLFDTVHEVTLAESEKYHQFLALAKKILDQIDLDDIDTKVSEIEELADLADSEERRVIDSAKIRKRVDDISSSAKAAADDKKWLGDVVTSVAAEEKAIHDKIIYAAQNFDTQSAHKKAEALDIVSGKIAATTSLAEIDSQILQDPQFFNLLAEIRRVPVWGQKVEELFVDDLPQRPSKIQLELKRIILEAKAQKQAIDDNFTSVPSSQAEVDRIVNRVGMILDTTDFNHFITSRGVLRVEVARQEAIRQIMDPQAIVTAGGGPPPPPVAKPKNILENYKNQIANIKDKRAAGAKAKINGFLQTLEEFYAPAKVAVIKREVQIAGDGTAPRYQPSYESLSDALAPFTVDGLRMALDRGGKVQGSEDETEFYKNFIKIMKSRVNDALFKKMLTMVNQKMEQRVTFLKKWILEQSPSMLAIEAQFAQLDLAKTQMDLHAKCLDINVNLAAILKHPIKCGEIGTRLTDGYASANRSVPTWESGLLVKARGWVREAHDVKSEIIMAAGGKDEKAKIEVAGKLEEFVIPKGVADLKARIRDFNDQYLQVGAAIDISAQMQHHYDNQSLIRDIVHMLRNEKIGEGKKSAIYAEAIDLYGNELYRGMTPGDIATLKANIDKNSPHRLAKISLVLSSKGLQEVTQPFAAPLDEVLIENMKKAALGRHNDGNPEGAGIPDFEAALDAVYCATDDIGTNRTITTLANFFKDVPSFRGKVIAAATLAGVDHSNNFGLLGQLGPIKAAVEGHDRYKALTEIVNLEAILPSAIVIVNGPQNLAARSAKISDTLRLAIFGVDSGDRRIVVLFNELQNALTEALSFLRLEVTHGRLPAVHAGVIEPIANAFNLVFAHPLDKLNQCTFDGSQDAAIATAFALFDGSYAEKFTRLKVVITDLHLGSGNQRRVFKLLEGYNDGVFHPGLKDKVGAGSTSPETIALTDHIGNFLR